MAGLTCPNCNAIASTAEIASGWCESCGKKIPFSYTAAAHAPNRTAREALLAPAPKAPRRSKTLLGTLLAAGVGVLLSVLLIVLLRAAGYLLILVVVSAIMLAAVSLGQIADGMLVNERK